MKRAAGLLAAALASGGAGAADDPYRIELLVFAQPEPAGEEVAAPGAAAMPEEPAVDFRRYPCLPLGADPETAPTLRGADDVAACLDGYLRLNELREAMVEDRLRLSRAGGFRILAHAAWRQPALAPDAARRVRLAAAAPAGAPPALEGWARFSRAQHLQLDFELRYRPDTAAPAQVIRLHRKLRGGATNYLDHPRIGILALVTPAPAPADAPEAAAP